MPSIRFLHHHNAPTGDIPTNRPRAKKKRTPASQATPQLAAPEPKPADLTPYLYEGDYSDFDESIGPYFVVPRCYEDQPGRFLPCDP